jgi:plasmid stabilization system protein ParE
MKLCDVVPVRSAAAAEMARVELSPDIQGDFGRIIDHLLEHEVADAQSRVRGIVKAIDVLEENPLMGRPVANDLRELIIGRKARGYVAL